MCENHRFVFLRGVNVNGKTLSMAELKKAFRTAGFERAETVGASGNLVLHGKGAEETAALTKRILKESFGFTSAFFLRTGEELADLLEAARRAGSADGGVREGSSHLYAVFCEGETGDELARLFPETAHGGGEAYSIAGRDGYWIVPKGSTLKTDFGKLLLGSARFRDRVTTRTAATVEKLLSLGK